MAKENDRRAQAAAARAEAEIAAKRDQRIKIFGGIAVAVVVIGIVLAGYLGAQASKPHASAGAPQPKGTLAGSYGWPLKPIDPAKSTLVIYEDPQCPICRMFEQTFGTTVQKLAADSTVNVEYRIATFIDQNLPQSNHASRRALNGLGCAIDQGVGLQYHTLIYENQPANEGDGFSDQLLRSLGAKAGLTGSKLDAFNKCFDAGTYLGWADNSYQESLNQGIQGTPTVQLDGTTLPDTALKDLTSFTAYINAHKK